MRDNWWDKIALYLWRDRGGYDPATGGMSEDYNRSLRSRFRHWRYLRRGTIERCAPWLVPALIGSGAAIGAVFLSNHLDRPKAGEQVKIDPGELLLKCSKEGGDVLRCRPVLNGQHQVIPGPQGNRSDHDRAAKP